MSALMLSARLLYRAQRYRWKHDRQEIAALRRLLPRGGVAIDIGAHKGAYTWWMAKSVGPAGRVFAFEPQQRNAEPTALALRTLGHRQVKVIQAAVSDRDGEALIAVRPSSTHGASLSGLSGNGIQSVPVRTVSLDAFARAEGLTRVDFIKIDVEGHELEVLAGAREMLARYHPALLIEIETQHHAAGTDPFAGARAILDPLGYRAEFFTPAGMRPIAEFSPAAHQQKAAGEYLNNFLFTAPPTEVHTRPWNPTPPANTIPPHR